MTWLKTVWSEFLGLFVDDAWFALTILVWLAASWIVLPRLGQSGWPPVVLFAGLAAILFGSVVRGARRSVATIATNPARAGRTHSSAAPE